MSLVWTSGRVCVVSRLRRHSAHSPSISGVPPQAHLRCKSPLRTGVKDGIEREIGEGRMALGGRESGDLTEPRWLRRMIR